LALGFEPDEQLAPAAGVRFVRLDQERHRPPRACASYALTKSATARRVRSAFRRAMPSLQTPRATDKSPASRTALSASARKNPFWCSIDESTYVGSVSAELALECGALFVKSRRERRPSVAERRPESRRDGVGPEFDPKAPPRCAPIEQP
jgi:hypothetical protein